MPHEVLICAIATEIGGGKSRDKPAKMPVELRGADLEEALNAFLGAGVLPPSRPNTTVKNLETSVLLLPPSESGLLASKIFSHLLRVETRLRIAYQFSPAFLNWLVRQVQQRARIMTRLSTRMIRMSRPSVSWSVR